LGPNFKGTGYCKFRTCIFIFQTVLTSEHVAGLVEFRLVNSLDSGRKKEEERRRIVVKKVR